MESGTRGGSSFSCQVAAVVRLIPHGRVTTYGLIASALGAPRCVRLVGWSLNRYDGGSPLPAHRVVNKAGYLSGGHRFGHPDVMKQMLLLEGVEFTDEYVVDLRNQLWDPSTDPHVIAALDPHGTLFGPPPDFLEE